ncbi:MAG: hypothetical protein ACI9XB_000680 [Gammaproteobacteria bacterium]
MVNSPLVISIKQKNLLAFIERYQGFTRCTRILANLIVENGEKRTMKEFDEIRPYRDHEVSHVIQSLLNNDEFFEAIARFQAPRLKKVLPKLAKKKVEKALKKHLDGISSVAEFQLVIAKYMQKIIDNTTTGLFETGLDEIPKEKPHLFVSNHRDIVLDPALVSFLLRNSVHGTMEIAIGDNLLKRPYISELMRLNKSFIVQRSKQGREKLLALKLLSQYIHFSIGDGNNVWIAQREGRAKDGLDKTDPTIIKMLSMGKQTGKEKVPVGKALCSLNIIPVSISYEYNPCDELIAQELHELASTGSFEKDDRSDIISISTGLNENKGAVHVAYGKEICPNDDDDAVTIAARIDKQILLNYFLHSSNYLAYRRLRESDPTIGPSLGEMNVMVTDEKEVEFKMRYENLAPELKPYFLEIYANPVLNRLRLLEE